MKLRVQQKEIKQLKDMKEGKIQDGAFTSESSDVSNPRIRDINVFIDTETDPEELETQLE